RPSQLPEMQPTTRPRSPLRRGTPSRRTPQPRPLHQQPRTRAPHMQPLSRRQSRAADTSQGESQRKRMAPMVITLPYGFHDLADRLDQDFIAFTTGDDKHHVTFRYINGKAVIEVETLDD